MTRKKMTIPSSYFEARYRSAIDPWHFRTSDYERGKYAATIHALTRPAYHRALEVGCSIGVLTRLLAQRCRTLLAIDASPTAIEEAKRAPLSNVIFEVRFLPEEFPDGPFDLLLLSEVLYYFTESDLELMARECSDVIDPVGEIILCHWLGETDYPLSGQEASDIFARAIQAKLPVRTILRDNVFRLERFSTN